MILKGKSKGRDVDVRVSPLNLVLREDCWFLVLFQSTSVLFLDSPFLHCIACCLVVVLFLFLSLYSFLPS